MLINSSDVYAQASAQTDITIRACGQINPDDAPSERLSPSTSTTLISRATINSRLAFIQIS